MFIPFCLPDNIRIITIFGLRRIIVNGPMGREKDFPLNLFLSCPTQDHSFIH